MYLRLQQDSDPNKKVTRLELRNLSNLKDFVDRISNFGKLSPPEDLQPLSQWQSFDDMYFDFTIRQTTPGLPRTAKRVRVYQSEKPELQQSLTLTVQKIDKIITNSSDSAQKSLLDESFSLLEEPVGRL
ncbi:hypothetical protein MMC12_006669 [Toensbergia leucococca]|nr:hypothetical protein [Toensbergia leucococca]